MCSNPMVRDDVPADQAVTPIASTPMANAGCTRPACRPLPLGMSYPPRPTVHAGCRGSLRYGRTGSRLPGDPAPSTPGTPAHTRRNSNRFSAFMSGTVGAWRSVAPSHQDGRPRGPSATAAGAGVQGRPEGSGRRQHEDGPGGGPTLPGCPVRLRTGTGSDIPDVPAGADHTAPEPSKTAGAGPGPSASGADGGGRWPRAARRNRLDRPPGRRGRAAPIRRPRRRGRAHRRSVAPREPSAPVSPHGAV